MEKIPRKEYTAEFKEMAVKLVKEGQGLSAVARELVLAQQTLRNWSWAAEAGKLDGPDARKATL